MAGGQEWVILVKRHGFVGFYQGGSPASTGVALSTPFLDRAKVWARKGDAEKIARRCYFSSGWAVLHMELARCVERSCKVDELRSIEGVEAAGGA